MYSFLEVELLNMKKPVFIFIAVWLLVSPCFGGTVMRGSGGCVNLVTNGDFATLDGTGWETANGLTLDASSGAAVLTNVTSYGFVRQLNVTEVDSSYTYSFDVTGFSSGGNPQFTNSTQVIETITGNGNYSGNFTATSTYIRFYFPFSGGTITIDNVAVCAQ
jgi:hypothetical protein